MRIKLQRLVFFIGLFGLIGQQAWAQATVSGTVFEDANYGGGAGRSRATLGTGAVGQAGAMVELYDANGLYLTNTTTDVNGLYSFATLGAGNYSVRVVNQTVTSSRPGAVSGLLPVQTFRTTNGTADPNRVGGETPAKADFGPNINNTTLTFTGVNSTTDQTIFLDNVEVLQGGTALTTNPISNPGFENGTLTANNGTYQYAPTGVGFAWLFNSQAGIQANNSAFTPPNTASGARAGFVQSAGGSGGTISQGFSLPAGTYTIRFQAANRIYGGQQTLNVAVNGTTVLANVQAASGTYASYQTAAFTVAAGGGSLSSIVAQSVAPVTVGSADITGIDFGFSFDVVTNTNDGGQGSLRQFILNANTLTNTGLAQAGQVAGSETSIFMVPNGVAGTAAPAGLQRTPAATSGLNGSSGTNTWALIALASPLPTLTDQGTILDASTQTTNIQDSNPGQVGLGGPGGQFPTVGVGNLPFGQFNCPEVEVYGANSLANVLLITANNSTVRGFSLHGAGNTTGTVNALNVTGLLLENNLIGITATAIADPTLTIPNSAGRYGVYLSGVTIGALVRRNVVAYSSNSGIYVPSGGTGANSAILITGNELVQNGFRVSGGDNITLGDAGNTGPVRIVANLIRTANSNGVQLEIGQVGVGGTGFNTLRNNTFFDNGNGGSSVIQSQLEGAAILYLQRNGTRVGTNADSLYLNIITQTQASAIVVGYGQRGVIITRNSTYFNGTPFNSPTGGNLGIDLIANPAYFVGSGNTIGAADYGNGDGVTPNSGTLTTAFGNGGSNYPIITQAAAAGSTSPTVNVAGYVGSAPGQTAFAGAIVDFYTADNVPANNNGAISGLNPAILPHGEGRTYLSSLTCDANGNFSGQLTVPANTPPLAGSAVTGFLTATATLPATSMRPSPGTSEFGPNQPIIVAADVQASITGGGATPAGTTGTFTATFSNQASSDPIMANGVVATVQLPAGLAGVTVTGGGSYASATGLVTYSAYPAAMTGSLAPGASFSSTITYTQPATTSVTATATIGTTTNEAGQTANNTSTATNSTGLLYDVTTAISGPTGVTAGNQVAYNVTTTNVGGAAYPSPAPQVVQTVTVPAGAANVFVTGGGVVTGSLTAGYTVTFPTIAALGSGQAITNTVSFTAPASNYSLGASVSSSPADAVSTNNSATTSTIVGAASSGSANVFALISTSAVNAAPNAPITFTVTQGNHGPNPATGVSTTVVVSPGLPTAGAAALTINGNPPTAVSGGTATYANGTTYNPATGLVTFPVIASQGSGTTSSGASSTVTYTIGFNAPLAGVATATVAVQSTSSDNLPADNQATAQVTVAVPADLSVVLIGPNAATVGQPLTYTLTSNNNGPASATAVSQTVNLPAGLPLSGFAPLLINGAAPTAVTNGVATYAGGISYQPATGVLTIPPVATLDPSGVLTTTIAYTAPADGGQSLIISAAVTSPATDPVLSNNTTSLATALQATADVQVSLTVVGQIEPGNRITYGVTTLNNGPSPAPGVATTVILPTGLPITGTTPVLINGAAPQSVAGNVATYPDGSTYDAGTSASSSTPGQVTLPALSNLQAAGAKVNTISFVLPATYRGSLSSTATATVTGITDPIPSNNTAVVQPVILAASGTNDLGVTLTAGATTVTAGQPVTLTLTTTSTSAGSGVLQFVQLTPGLTTIGGTVTVTSGGKAVSATYEPVNGLLTLPPILNVAANSSLSYVITISQAPGSGPLVATASVSNNELDSNSLNNLALVNVGITPLASLITTVTGPATTPTAGPVSYLISTANGGPSTTTGTAQTVTVPAGATNVQLNGVSVTPGTGGVISLPVPAILAPGGANTITNTLSFIAPGAAGSSFTVPTSLTASGYYSPVPTTTTTPAPATATASQTTTISSPAPIASNVVNNLQAPEGNTAATPLPIAPLAAQAQGVATLASYTIAALPPASQGVLYVGNGTVNTLLSPANFPNLVLTPAQAQSLRFQPAAGFAGNATFLYLATDNAGTPSAPARYLIPVGPDANTVYSNTLAKGGANHYQTNDVLAYVIDPNGAQYNSSGLVYNNAGTTGPSGTIGAKGGSNGLANSPTSVVAAASGNGPTASGPYPANPTNALPPGVSLDPITGLIFVSDATKLVNNNSAQYYQINVTTTDLNGGTNPVVARFSFGASPLPVELAAFAARAGTNGDALLSWVTASELNNGYFGVERSRDGAFFTQIAQVTGQGTKASPTTYALIDKGIGAQLTGDFYYRLRQVDTNGTSTYSPVRTIHFDPTASLPASLSLFPNPAHATTTLDLRNLSAGAYQVTLTDAAGRLVLTQPYVAGLTPALALQTLSNGTYLVRLTGTATNGTVINLHGRLTKE